MAKSWTRLSDWTEQKWGQINRMTTLHTSWSLSVTYPWTIAVKLLVIFSWVEHTVLRGMSPVCPPLPDKAIKLFFSTWPKSLTLRFDLELVHRDGVLVSLSVVQTKVFSLPWLPFSDIPCPNSKHYSLNPENMPQACPLLLTLSTESLKQFLSPLLTHTLTLQQNSQNSFKM